MQDFECGYLSPLAETLSSLGHEFEDDVLEMMSEVEIDSPKVTRRGKQRLSDTLSEAGRYGTGKYDRQCKTRRERHSVKTVLHQITSNIDLRDPASIDSPSLPPRGKPAAGVQPRENLGPLRTWLSSRVGRAWNDIIRELRSRHAGRNASRKFHLLLHVGFEVAREKKAETSSPRFQTNNGVLMKHIRQQPGSSPCWLNILKERTLSDRVVKRGGMYYWARPARWETLEYRKTLPYQSLAQLEDHNAVEQFRLAHGGRKAPYGDRDYFAPLSQECERALIREWSLAEQLSAAEVTALYHLPRLWRKKVLLQSLKATVQIAASELP